jgi:hypothetical protein
MLDHIVLLENDVFQSFWLVKSLSMIMIIHWYYPLVNVYKTMENHHFSWENPL